MIQIQKLVNQSSMFWINILLFFVFIYLFMTWILKSNLFKQITFFYEYKKIANSLDNIFSWSHFWTTRFSCKKRNIFVLVLTQVQIIRKGKSISLQVDDDQLLVSRRRKTTMRRKRRKTKCRKGRLHGYLSRVQE